MRKRKILLIFAALLAIAQGAWAWTGSGTQADPYLITNATDWNNLVTAVNGGETYSGTYFKMTASVETVTQWMTGTFSGTFDGDGKTLTVNYSATGDNCAPFGLLSGATIKNLIVAGNISSSFYRPCGIAAQVTDGTVTITNCRSSVNITASRNGDANPGGFVGRVMNDKSLNMTDCAFTGSISFTDAAGYEGGGMVGYLRPGSTTTLTNCLFAPSSVSFANTGDASAVKFYMFACPPSDAHTLTLTNCYYNGTAAGNAKITVQGTDGSGMTAAQLAEALGPGWHVVDGKAVPMARYEIATTTDWNNLVTAVNGGETYSGTYFKMTASVETVTQWMTGTFSGTFDGDGKTLTVNYSATGDNCAPFGLLSGATIKNLIVAGNISSSFYRPCGIAAQVTDGTVTITNCRSSVNITASRNGDANPGGFVGRVMNDKSLNMTDCAFTGSISFTDAAGYEGGGMVGYLRPGSTTTLTNCLFAPSSVSFANTGDASAVKFYMFACPPSEAHTLTLTNCFYNDVAAAQTKITAQGGKQMHSISAGTDVSSLAISGASTEYGVSGITVYSTGIKYNDVYYAGNGDEVSLTLTHAENVGYTFSTYTTTGGSLASATTNSPTLTMPDANVTISAEFTKNEVTLTDGVNLSASGLTSYEGQQCDVTYTRAFTSGKTSTVCLPFAYTKQEGDGKFYEFTSITEDGDDYVATMTEPGESTLAANTPYLFTPAKSSVTFTGTIASVPASFGECTTTSNGWTFKGTYETIQWTEAPTGIYGFSAQDVAEQGISQGEFVKVGEYVRVKPMRCYLQYGDGTSDWAGARGMNRAAADEPLPETIKVRLVSANGDVTAIGTLQTKTGEVTMDNEAWYSLDGRRIVGQPNAKGIYVNNGKKVIIK